MTSRSRCVPGACARLIFILVASAASWQAAWGQAQPEQNGKAKPAPIPGQAAKTPDSSQEIQSTGPASEDSAAPAQAQPQAAAPPPMEFESHGLSYEALTRNGITVMFAPLPPRISSFNAVQVTVTNGSLVSWTVKPADFTFVRQDGTRLLPVSADEVVATLLQKASRNDVIRLQLLYEQSIYSLSNYRSTNGYEQRREAAMAQFVNRGFKAAAQASAITLVPTKLKPGDSTDGAVFFENRTKDKSLGAGRLIAHTCGETFVFTTYPEPKSR